MKIITSADIKQWARRVEAPAYLPSLMYRLIRASASTVLELDFPAGEGVGLGGWDGVVVAKGVNPYVPDGRSVWELSTQSDVRAKAEEDYVKRDGDPGAATSTYIAVTANSSPVIRTWADEKKSDGRWGNVRGYDANRLASWIESLPAVARWFGGVIGKIPRDVVDLDGWWDQWSAATTPASTGQLVLAGLDKQAQRIIEWTTREPSAISVSAATEDEAIAIAVAAFRSKAATTKSVGSAWVVTSREAWTQLVASTEPLVLIAAFPDRAGVEAAVGKHHHVLVPLDIESPSATIEIRSRPRQAVRDALGAMGIGGRKLDELTNVGRLSLSALRRRLATIPGITQPRWSLAAEAPGLIAPLLAGRWDDSNASDRNVLERLAGLPYNTVITAVRRWANESDPPVRIQGTHVRLVDRLDAWVLLHEHVGREHLELLTEVATLVLDELDPKYELPVERQYAAGAYGKVLTYSAELREGLGEMIALLAATSSTHPATGPITGQTLACGVVRQLLNRKPLWHTWASVSPLLPLMAEACPDEFESALDAALEDPDFVPGLFTDKELSFTTSSAHTGLLWALEVLAWSPDHLTSSTHLLARLAATEPGGRLTNRPINSLIEIYRLWHPCTAASAETRKSALSALTEAHAEIAWQVLAAILPQLMGVAHTTVTPRWRPWAVEPSSTSAEIWSGVTDVIELMLKLVDGHAKRWITLIDLLDDLPRPQFAQILNGLRSEQVRQMPEGDRSEIWGKLRDLVNRHREFSDARWALPTDSVNELATILDSWAPTDPVLLHGWLFTDWPEIPGRRDGDWAEDEAEIRRLRQGALKGVLAADGVNSIVAFAVQVASPWTVGAASVGLLDREQLYELLRRTLNSESDQLQRIGRGALLAIRHDEPDTVPALLEQANWSPSARGDIFTAMPFTPETWLAVGKEELEVRKAYWQRVNIYQPLADDPDNFRGAISGLIDHAQSVKAVRMIAHHLEQAPAELIAAALLATATSTQPDPVAFQPIALDVPHLLAKLAGADISQETVVELEWVFLPLIREPFHQPLALIAKLQGEPAFFVQTLTRIYRRRDAKSDTGEDPTELQKADASRGFTLLYHWKTPPGCAADGSIDEPAVRKWIEEARSLAADAGRKEVADSHIGQVLVYMPSKTGEPWPPDALGRILEAIHSPQIEEGLSMGLYNKRGIVTKTLSEGGMQERVLAEQYSSAASRLSRYPRLARTLRRVARGYEDQGTWEDQNAEAE
jgi:hypothetical protein